MPYFDNIQYSLKYFIEFVFEFENLLLEFFLVLNNTLSF